ncbi:MAG TPA: four helix bundle protein [Anaerolineae bacterium]|nr:four helix bundle protein [Anaerolineae bacterium]
MVANLPHARSFRDLLVYRKARELAREIFRLTAEFPKDEMFSLTSQIRRSSRAIGANIAEAWAKRRYAKHFISKLSDADGEQYETQHWIDTAIDCGYWTVETGAAFTRTCEEIGRLLGGMTAKASLFCGEPPQALHELAPEYLVNDIPLPTTDH